MTQKTATEVEAATVVLEAAERAVRYCAAVDVKRGAVDGLHALTVVALLHPYEAADVVYLTGCYYEQVETEQAAR